MSNKQTSKIGLSKETYDYYKDEGFQLLELGNGKAIKHTRKDKTTGGWTSDSDQWALNTNYAVVPPRGTTILDVDIKNPAKDGMKSLEDLRAFTGMDLVPSVETGSGGVHIYIKTQAAFPVTHASYPGIDILGHKENPAKCPSYGIAGGQTLLVGDEAYEYKLLNSNIAIDKEYSLVQVLDGKLYAGSMVVDGELYDEAGNPYTGEEQEMVKTDDSEILADDNSDTELEDLTKASEEAPNLFNFKTKKKAIVGKIVHNYKPTTLLMEEKSSATLRVNKQTIKDTDKTPLSKVKELLEWCDSDCDYDYWMKVCAILKREYGDEAFPLFHAWSETCSKFKGLPDCRDKWDTIGEVVGKPSTVATIYKIAIDSKVDTLKSYIADGGSVDEVNEIISSKAWLEYPKLDNKYVVSIIPTYCDTFGVTYNDATSTVNKLLKSKYAKGKVVDDRTDEEKATDMTKNLALFDEVLAFNSPTGRCPFFYKDTGSLQSGNLTAGQLLEPLTWLHRHLGYKSSNDPNNDYVDIDKAVSLDYIKTVKKKVYLPKVTDRVGMYNARDYYYNAYDVTTVSPSDEPTEAGTPKVKAVLDHISMLCGKTDAEVFLDWLAWVTQNPGDKLTWVPIIQSVGGVGKSVLVRILINHVFGKEHSTSVDSSMITSGNNSWIFGKSLIVLNELTISSKREINDFKTMVTESEIQIKEKYAVTYETDQCANFIGITNDIDALKLESCPRRWYRINSPVERLSDVPKLMDASDLDEYFTPLHEFAEPDCVYGREFKHFLLARDVSHVTHESPTSHADADLRELEESRGEHTYDIQDLFMEEYGVERPPIVSRQELREASERIKSPYHALTAKDLNDGLNILSYKKLNSRKGSRDYIDGTPAGGKAYYLTTDMNAREAIALWGSRYDNKPSLGKKALELATANR